MQTHPNNTSLWLPSQFDTIPNEVWEQIFTYLDKDNTKRARLCTRRWTHVAAPYLFRPQFTFRPDRPDFENFAKLVNCGLNKHVTAIYFASGVMDIADFAHSVGENDHMDHDEVTEEARALMLEQVKKEGLKAYALW